MADIIQPEKIIYKGASAEIVEKKSRFIANVSFANTEENALAYIESIKKKYYDAKHNCYAFIIAGIPNIERKSDDGEPQGTAGKPMLDILVNNELTNLVAVVTRYFGGTLLGTGGLVRAYQGALIEAINKCTIITKLPGFKVEYETNYNDLGKLQYYASQNDIAINDITYAQNVNVSLIVPNARLDALSKYISNLTYGKVSIDNPTNIFYADIDNKRKLL